MFRRGLSVVVGVLVASWGLAADGPAKPAPSPTLATRIVYISDNFMHDDAVTHSTEIIRKAAAAGYNAVFMTDCKFDRWNDKATVQRPQYDNNVRKVRQLCRDLNMQVIVSCLGQGSDLMSVDPSLAEGMPVNDAPMLIKDGQIVPADEDFKPVNLGFEQSNRPDQPVGWNVDFPGKCAFLDKDVKYEGAQSLRFEDISANSSYGNGRANQLVKVKPWRYYHVSFMVKTQDFPAVRTINAMVLGKSNGLVHQTFDIKPTQDWSKIDIVFNTLENTEVTLYFGSWGGGKGKLWVDDAKVDAGGFVNLIRRPSLTFKVTSEDGKTVYEEGKDYDKVVDPKLLNTPWPGAHGYWYEQPVVKIPAGSRLTNGQKVLASYSHAMNTLGWGIFACMAEPRTLELAKANLQQLHKVIDPDAYMLPYDELRHMGFDESCQKSGMTPCQMLMENTKAALKLIRAEDPGKPIYAWNDMFDPYHNASKRDQYDYLVKGKDPFYGSWEALDKDVIILNWQGSPEARKQSMKHFADRGHKQILCGYYDAPSEAMASWLKDAKDTPGIIGVTYTTWSNNYSELEKYMNVCREACSAK